MMNEAEALEKIRDEKLPRYTDRSITDPDQFLEEVIAAREKGYATDDEEYISGVRAIAAPINGEKGRLAAIWVVGFKASLNENKMKILEEAIKEAVEAINLRIKEQSGLQVGE